MSHNNLNELDDRTLLERVALSDTKAFDSLFGKYWERTFSDAYKRLRNEAEAKDIIQDIFTHLWLNRETLKILNLPDYLYVAVRNLIVKLAIKKHDTCPSFDFLENTSKGSMAADAKLLWEEFLKSYKTSIDALSSKRQEIFRLRYHDDLPTKDIAQRLVVTRKTVQNQLGKAVKSFRTAILSLG